MYHTINTYATYKYSLHDSQSFFLFLFFLFFPWYSVNRYKSNMLLKFWKNSNYHLIITWEITTRCLFCLKPLLICIHYSYYRQSFLWNILRIKTTESQNRPTLNIAKYCHPTLQKHLTNP